MADEPLPDENLLPPPDDSDEVDSRVGSDLEEGEGEASAPAGSEGEDGEDLMDNLSGDYRAMPELDRYDPRDIDDAESGGSFGAAQGARLAADLAMERGDAREGRVTGRRARLPGALEEDIDEEDRRPTQRRRMAQAQAGQMSDEEEEPLEVDINAKRGPIKTWIGQDSVQAGIHRLFRDFLQTFSLQGEHVYQGRLREMCSSNKETLEVEFQHMVQWRGGALRSVALWLVEAPREIVALLQKAARQVAEEEFEALYAQNAKQEVHVRIAGIGVEDSLRDIRQFHLNKMIKVAGVVTRRTGVFPQLQMVKFDCQKCGHLLGPYYQNTETEIRVNSCPQCQGKHCFTVNMMETIYRNYQKITLQEAPGQVPAGRIPRHKDVILLHDLIDIARPGELVVVTGIYHHSYDKSLNIRNGFPVFSTIIEAHHVGKSHDDFAAFKLTDEDKEAMHKLSKLPDIGIPYVTWAASRRICRSVAPSIYGHENIKMGIALALFGGQEKNSGGTHRLRGDINMLLLGDPGTAKSQFLKYVEKVASRAVYTTGKGASAVGLTASVQKDAITKEWTLEGGALVLADKGVCLIDEFDKMNDQDRVSIHEAMEQQSISISKAGIVTSLQARCSVIAAANPVGGRYDSSRTFAENVELSDPILSRFDILCVVKDAVDPVADARLARFVVSSHARSHPLVTDPPRDEQGRVLQRTRPVAALDQPLGSEDVLSQDELRKYIMYAKQTRRPRLDERLYEKIVQVYAELRRESAVSQGMPVAVRHLESIIRMSEAHAAMHMRDYVAEPDVNAAIRVMVESFVATQKVSVQKSLMRTFSAKYIKQAADFDELLMSLLQGLLRERLRYEQMRGTVGAGSTITLPVRLLRDKAHEYELEDVAPFFNSRTFLTSEFLLDQDADIINIPRDASLPARAVTAAA